MKVRQIPAKNYVILGVVSLLSFLFVWYCSNWYFKTEEYRVEASPIVEIISEIHMNEVSNYILDNGSMMLYTTSFQKHPNIEFEKKLKKLILKYDMGSRMVVLDYDKVIDANFFQNLENQFLNAELKQKNVKISDIPNLIVFENGQIVDVYHTTDQTESFEKLERIFKQHQATEE